jgi:hypothetical protein
MTVLSASSRSTWDDCHLQWYFQHVEKRPEPFSEPRDTGLRVHDAVEWILKDGSDSVPDFDNMSERVAELVTLFSHEVYPTYEAPVLVEAAFQLDVLGITYTGFIDSVDIKEFPGVDALEIIPFPASVVLRDLKTTKSRKAKGKHRDALIGYYLGARELGQPVDYLQLDYLVRTKKPYYWPERQEVPDEDEIDQWAFQVERAAREIEEGDWEPTGLGTYVCNYCSFKDICGPYDRYSNLMEAP